MTKQKPPQGIQLTPLDEGFRENPYPTFANMLRRSPVYRDDEFNRVIVSQHDDVAAILRDKKIWSDPRKANPDSMVRQFLSRDDEAPSMLLMDDPDHKRLRSLVNKAFTPRAVEEMRPRVREIAVELLDEIEADEFDFMDSYAGPLPTIVIAEMLGVDRGLRKEFKAWSDASVFSSFNPFCSDEEREAGDAARTALNDLFKSEIAARRRDGGEDLIAGNVTTTDLLGNGVKALIDHPSEMEKLRNDPDLIENTVEEMLRFDSPVTNSGRVAHEEMEVGGCPIHKGESITTFLGAANHDPSINPDPERFDVTREKIHHQSFGGGRHHCLGAPLARLEAQEGVACLLERYKALEASPKGYIYRTLPSFRGMTNYWVRGTRA
jgi:hypothetical protein